MIPSNLRRRMVNRILSDIGSPFELFAEPPTGATEAFRRRTPFTPLRGPEHSILSPKFPSDAFAGYFGLSGYLFEGAGVLEDRAVAQGRELADAPIKTDGRHGIFDARGICKFPKYRDEPLSVFTNEARRAVLPIRNTSAAVRHESNFANPWKREVRTRHVDRAVDSKSTREGIELLKARTSSSALLCRRPCLFKVFCRIFEDARRNESQIGVLDDFGNTPGPKPGCRRIFSWDCAASGLFTSMPR
jgi:hypothetical protein